MLGCLNKVELNLLGKHPFSSCLLPQLSGPFSGSAFVFKQHRFDFPHNLIPILRPSASCGDVLMHQQRLSLWSETHPMPSMCRSLFRSCWLEIPRPAPMTRGTSSLQSNTFMCLSGQREHLPPTVTGLKQKHRSSHLVRAGPTELIKKRMEAEWGKCVLML